MRAFDERESFQWLCRLVVREDLDVHYFTPQESPLPSDLVWSRARD